MQPVLVHAHNPGPLTGPGNNTWLLPGRRAALVDTGTGLAPHLNGISQRLAEHGATLTDVLVTHGHADHCSGAAALVERFGALRFRKIPWPDHDRRYPVGWEPLADGDVVQAGDVQLQVVHTPGHAPDHIVFWHEASRAALVGDLVIQGQTVVIPPTHGGRLLDYLDSIRRLIAMAPSRLYPAHGPVIDDPVPLLEQYLAHRQRREEQVIDAMSAGNLAISEIIDRIYPGLHPELRMFAAENVLAHLEKLEAERRVVRTTAEPGDRFAAVAPGAGSGSAR